MAKRTRLWMALAIVALFLTAGTALIVHSAQPTTTIQAPPESKPTGGEVLTKSAGLATQVANGLVGTPPNAATQTEGAKPFPTCIAQPGALPTPVIATPAYPNDPLPDARRTAIASQNAAGLGYTVPSKTVDLAPQVAVSDKWQVTVGHADCSTERYLVSGDKINTFTSTLPKGSVVVDIFAPPSMGPHHPVGPAPSAPTPNVTRSSVAPPSTAKPTSR